MPVGRPRSFDSEKAIDRAMRVFWRKGYEGTSLPDLTKAMRINRPSLYAAFGNKEALFRKVLDHYAEGPAAYVLEALEARTSREVADRLLRGAIDLLTDKKHPGGCLLVQGALACGDEADSVRNELALRRTAGEAALRKRLERAKAEGELSRSVDHAGLARFLSTVIQGMAVQAAGGTRRPQLEQVADAVLSRWP